MKTFLILLSITFLASCTLIERAGIEKRRFRAGYYIPSLSAQQKIIHHASDSSINKKNYSKDKIEAISSHPEQPKGNNELAVLYQPVQSNPDKTTSTALTNTTKEKYKITSLLNEFPLNISQNYTAKRSTLEFTNRKSILYRGHGHGCSLLLVAVVLLLIVLLVMTISQTTITPGAIFLACGIVLLIMLVSVLIRESRRAAHSREIHDHLH
ncbi:MAG: hypothetical protein ABR968_08630 [Bacteroidales bacterium]|jgi:hypothetical protein